MADAAQSLEKEPRSTRVKLGGSILALIVLENGRQIHARLSQLSVNGGLLSMEKPLDESIRVTLVFHVGGTSIRCRSQILFPIWATQGVLQPFRFLELSEEYRASLSRELESLVRGGALEEQESD